MQDTPEPATIATLTNTSYSYYPDSLNASSGTGEGLNTESKEYKTLFMNTYWLASSHIYTYSPNATFGMRCVISRSRELRQLV